MRDVFLNRIWQSMADNKKIFFITADFGSPVLDKIRADFPNRFINVGIAEQNLINITAGLALEGFDVFAYAIAPFITMRCYEQIRVSLALLSKVRQMNVNLIGVGAGYSYVVSGPTHQCYEDISIMRALPNIEILSPADHITVGELYNHVAEKRGIKYFRFDAQVLPIVYTIDKPNTNFGFSMLRNGKNLCIISTGYMTHTAIKIADSLFEDGYSIGVMDLFNITHFDVEAMRSTLANYDGIITMEEGFRGRGGVDSMIFEFIARNNPTIAMHNIGVKADYRFELGSREQLHEQAGIGYAFAHKEVNKFIERQELLKNSY